MGGEEGGAVNGEGESGIRGINIWEEGGTIIPCNEW
jgi:hypothetical protein